MKSGIYFILILFLFGSGAYNLIKNDGKPTELPFSLEDTSEPKILPNDEWETVMLGEWDFRTTFRSRVFKGTVTYNPDNTFMRKVSFKEGSGKSLVQAGGTLKGTWKVNPDRTWVENADYCNIQPTNEYDVCGIFFDEPVTYGEAESDTWLFELRYFNNSKIVFQAKSLADDDLRTYSFSRIGEPPTQNKEESKIKLRGAEKYQNED